MVFMRAAAAALLVASVSAHNAHHAHGRLHERHGVEGAWHEASGWPAASSTPCGCYTYTTTIYGEAGLVPWTVSSSSTSSTSTSTSSTSTSTSTSTSSSSTSTTSSSTSTPPPPPPTTSSTTPPPPPPPTTTSTSTEAPAPTTHANNWAASPASSSSSSDSSSSNNGNGWGNVIGNVVSAAASVASQAVHDASVAVNGEKWAMTYTPYTNSGDCKSASAVMADMQDVANKGFTTVRIYATDCNALPNVGAGVKAAGLKLIVGVYIDGSGLGPAQDQVNAIISWGQWDCVEMVVVGNEVLFNGWVSSGALAGFISSTKGSLRAAGYSGPVTTSDVVTAIQGAASDLCPVIDVVAANIHPFFNTGTDAAQAGPFVASQLSLLAAACGNTKDAYCLETGWPSAGDANGDAIPGIVNQQIAIASLSSHVGSKSAFFSFQNDGWKAPGNLGVEQFWGCLSLF